MSLVRRFIRNCSSFFFLLFCFSIFSVSVFAGTETFYPIEFLDCATEGPSCHPVDDIKNYDSLIGEDGGSEYTSDIWPDETFGFSGDTAWADNANPHFIQFNFDLGTNPTSIDQVKIEYDGVFIPSSCVGDCRFKFLSSTDGFISDIEEIYSHQGDLSLSPVLDFSIPSSQHGSLNSLSLKLLAYGNPLDTLSLGFSSLIDYVRLIVDIQDAPINLGWNIRSESPNPGDRPVDLVCGQVTNADFDIHGNGKISQNWEPVNAPTNIKYQRQYKWPGSSSWSTDGTDYTNTHIPFSTFGSAEGTEGEWDSRVRAWVDVNGNNSLDEGVDTISDWSNKCSIIYDRTPPAQPILESPTNDAFVSGNPTQTWSNITDAHHYIYESYSDQNLNLSIYSNPDISTNQRTVGGNQTVSFWWRVKAVDSAGNESSWSNAWKLNVDNTPPAVPTGLRRLAKNDHNVVFACGDYAQIQGMHPDWDDNTEDDDFDYYEYSSFNAPNGSIGVDKKRFNNSIFEYNGSWLPNEGTYGFAVRAVDNAGNKSDWSLTGETLGGSCQIIYDSTFPVVGITSPSEGDKMKGIVDIKGFVTDQNLSHYNISVYPGGVDVHDFSLRLKSQTVHGPGFTEKSLYSWDTSSYPQGEYQIRLAARDLAGNRQLNGASEHVITVTIDNTPPTVDITFPLNGGVISGTTTVLINADDLTSGVERVDLSYRAVGDTTWIPLPPSLTSSPYTYNWNTTGYPLGDYELMAKAFDAVDNFATDQIGVGVAAVISGEAGSTPSFGQIYVSWFTDRPTTAQVVYDTVSHLSANPSLFNYGYAYTTGVFDLGKTTFHETLLTGLNDMTTYYYRFISAGSPAAVSDEMNNRTFSASGPGSPPSSGPSGGGTPSPLVALVSPGVMGVYTTPVTTLPEEGEVLGEEATPTPEPEKPTPSEPVSTPEILGISTPISPLYFLGAGLLISLILMALLFRRK